jgi:C-terminal peptidase prc
VSGVATSGAASIDVRATTQAMLEMVQIPTKTATPENQPTPANEFVPVFRQAWNIVNENYVRGDFNGVDWEGMFDIYLPQVEAVTSQEEFWNLMRRFIGELGDDHSRFVPPTSFGTEFDIPELQDNTVGGNGGLGMIVWPAREDEYLFVWDVCSRSPVANAGISRGTIIYAVNGQDVVAGEKGFSSGAVFSNITPEDTQITLTVQKGPDQPIEELIIPFGSVSGCPGWQRGLLSETPRIGYIRIPDFSGESDTLLWEFLQELEADAPLDGLILDVRHNPGGNSDRDAAIFTEGTFGKTGPLREGELLSIVRIRGPVRWNTTTPMAVLTDGSSHSAAEYFSTYMQQSARAVIVGQPTAGNTEAITGFSLPDGSVIRLAFQILQLPDGSLIEDVGVQPDVSVPNGQWGLIDDIQLKAAFDAVIGQIE